MICSLCETKNPDSNKFCGNCGAALIQKPEPAPVSKESEPSNSGFSFLGLADEPETSLVEDDLPEGRAVSDSSFLGLTDSAPAYTRIDKSRRTTGSSLLGLSEPRQPVPTPYVHEKKERATTISGPSFLGLTDSEEDDSNSYLLEEATPRRSAGWTIFGLIALAVIGAFAWMEWQAYKTGSIPFWRTATVSQPQKPAEQASNTTPASPQSDNAATKSDATQPADESNVSSEELDKARANATSSPTPAPSQAKPSGSPEASTPEMTVTPNANAKPNSMANQAQTENAPPDKSPKDASAVEPKDNSKAASAKNKPATDEDSSEESSEKDTSTVAANVRPSRPAVEKPKPEVRPPDPRQNKMLVQGENYLYGRGVRKSCQQALVYFRAAANEENAPAMSHLGAMYASGNCVPIDRRAAYKWFARAGSTDPSNQWIQRNLNMLWRDMSAEERASVSNQ